MATQSSGTLSSATTSPNFTLPKGNINITMVGGVGTIALQRAFDGTTFATMSQGPSGTAMSYVLAAGAAADFSFLNVEDGATYRFNVTAFTSGTFTYRAGYGGV